MKQFMFVWLVFVAACGDGSSKPPTTPTPPQPPAPTLTGLTITGPSALRTGQSETLRADATLSNGTTQAAANPTWSSTNVGVATVNNSGNVTALSHGMATINVTAQGATAQFPIQVWQDYQGTWTGNYVINVCTDSGGFRGWCQVFPRGTGLPFRLVLAQTLGAAEGTLELGSFRGIIRGGIFDTRRFVGGATLTSTINGLVFNADVGTFSALSSANSLAGNLVVSFTTNGVAGNGYWEAVLETVSRSLSPISFDTRDFKARLFSFEKRSMSERFGLDTE